MFTRDFRRGDEPTVMYVTLLLIAPAVCEWVEISQQHYQKPVSAHHFGDEDWTAEDYVEETTRRTHPQVHRKNGPHYSFSTDSVMEDLEKTSSGMPHFPYKKPTFTNAFTTIEKTKKEHVEPFSETVQHRYRKPVRTQYFPTHTVTESYEESIIDLNLQSNKPKHLYQFHANEKATENSEETKSASRIYHNQSITGSLAWNKGNVNKVPKIGNVQRVQLEANAIRAPNFRDKPFLNTTVEQNPNELDKNRGDFKHLSLTDVKKGNNDRIVIANIEETLHDMSIENVKENYKFKNNRPRIEFERFSSKNSDYRSHTTEGIRESYKTTTIKPTNNVSLRTSIFGLNQNNTNPLFIADDLDTISHMQLNKNIALTTTHSEPTQITKRIDGPGKKSEMPKIIESKNIKSKITTSKDQESIEFITKTDNDSVFATISGDSDEVNIRKVLHTNEESGQNNEQAEQNNKPLKDSKSNTLENLMTLMKVVADTIKTSTRRSVNSKTRYLTKLKDTILANIKERIDSTWPDDPPERAHSRVTRGAHLEIPSSESALMTISFLTFAVFLIKLVLQVIQKYKHKTMMVTPAVVATVGRAAAAMKSSAKPLNSL